MALYTAEDAVVAQPVMSDGMVVVATADAVLAVPLAGGAPRVLAQEASPHGLAVLSGAVYFEGLQRLPVGDAVAPADSVPTFYEVALAGGTDTTIPGFGAFSPLTSDGSAVYLNAGATRILRWDPIANTSTDIDIEVTMLVDDVAVAGDYLYLAAQDISQGGLSNGLIARVPKTGGALERLVTGIGHPYSIAVDGAGMYWAEDRLAQTGTASGRLARSGPNGGDSVTLLDEEPTSLAVMNGAIVFSLGTEIDVVPTAGGTPRPIATGLTSAGMIAAEGARITWVDPASPPLGSSSSPVVMSACVPQ